MNLIITSLCKRTRVSSGTAPVELREVDAPTRPSETPRATARKVRRVDAHAISLVVHRYVGLVLAAFLMVAGVTGSIIAFHDPLDVIINPELRVARAPAPGAIPLDPFEIHARVQTQLEDAEPLQGIALHIEPDRTLNYWHDDDEHFVDPYTGMIVGRRTWGDITQCKKNLITFLYRLHFTLALGDVGVFIFGLVALLWVVDCFVGAYLTLPQRKKKPARGAARPEKSWLSRWGPAWLIKANTTFTLIFTWHRASGLWIWLTLLIFAWSGVALNLYEVYEPVTQAIFGKAEHDHDRLPHLDTPRKTPTLSMQQAVERGRVLMAEQSKQRGFEVYRESYGSYDPEHGTYYYGVYSSLDLSERLADTGVYLDGDTGKYMGFHARTGQHAGDTFTTWIVALHFGQVRGPGAWLSAFVSVLGLLVTALSVTGVWIWWRKRTLRKKHA